MFSQVRPSLAKLSQVEPSLAKLSQVKQKIKALGKGFKNEYNK